MPEKILIVGATGYIASKLIPLLLEDGHQVRCLARNPQKLIRRSWYGQVEIVKADVTNPTTLNEVMNGISTAYYLVHNMSAGQNYHQLDMQAATSFSERAKHAGVKRIVYLGGLANPNEDGLAQHLASRIKTGDCLRMSGLPVIEFRVGVVVGAGSVSFEMIRSIAEQFPFLVGPLWLRHKTQPVSVINVLQYLRAVPLLHLSENMTVDIGSKKTQTYIEIMLRYASIRKLKRLPLLLPFIPIEVMAFFIDKMSPVKYSYALPLVEGLKNDSLVQFTDHNSLFNAIEMIEYEKAVQLAMEETNLAEVERVWLEMDKDDVSCFHSGLAVQFDKISLPLTPNLVIEKLRSLATQQNQLLSPITFSGVTHSEDRICLTGNLPGKGKVWLEWLVIAQGNNSIIEQTAAIRPEGIAAYLFIYLNIRKLKNQLKNILHHIDEV